MMLRGHCQRIAIAAQLKYATQIRDQARSWDHLHAVGFRGKLVWTDNANFAAKFVAAAELSDQLLVRAAGRVRDARAISGDQGRELHVCLPLLWQHIAGAKS